MIMQICVTDSSPLTAKGKIKAGWYPVISSVKKSKHDSTAFQGRRVPKPHSKKMKFTTPPLSSGSSMSSFFEEFLLLSE